MHKIKFEIDAWSRGNVWIDGKEIQACEITYHAKAGELAIVTLKICGEVEGTFEVGDLTNKPDAA